MSFTDLTFYFVFMAYQAYSQLDIKNLFYLKFTQIKIIINEKNTYINLGEIKTVLILLLRKS